MSKRLWRVTRTWLVEAETAADAIEAARPQEADEVRARLHRGPVEPIYDVGGVVTKNGRVLTEAELAELVAEAERGYEVKRAEDGTILDGHHRARAYEDVAERGYDVDVEPP